MARGIRNIQPFERIVASTIRQRGLLPEKTRVGVAVSAGADSVALLRVLAALQPAFGWRLEVLHLNHNLRGVDSIDDEAFVRDLADGLSLPVRVDRIAPGRAPATGVEEWARQQRQQFFRSMRDACLLDRIATAHHRGDQAETVLFRLLRGAGSRGLGGIQMQTPDGIVRPFLDRSRDEIRDYLVLLDQGWREDASNLNPKYARNALRHRWLPDLTRDWNPSLEAILANTAEQLRDEARLLDRLADEEAHQCFSSSAHGWEGTVAKFRSLDVALQRRVILRLCDWLAGPAGCDDAQSMKGSPLGFSAVETIRDLWTEGVGAGRFAAHGLYFERSGRHIRATRTLRSKASATSRIPQNVPIPQNPGYLVIPPGQPGRYTLSGSARALEVTYLAGTESDSQQNPNSHSGYTGAWSVIDSNRLCFPVILRLWREGDVFQIPGSTSKRKIKELFQRNGVPVWRRSEELILESGGAIVWTSSFGLAAEFAAKDDSERCLAIRLVPFDQEWESSSADPTS